MDFCQRKFRSCVNEIVLLFFVLNYNFKDLILKFEKSVFFIGENETEPFQLRSGFASLPSVRREVHTNFNEES